MKSQSQERIYGNFPGCSISTDSVGTRLIKDGAVIKGIPTPQVKKIFRFDITKLFKKWKGLH